MTTGMEDLRSLERKIGEIVGIISPLPNQLNQLFERLDKESRDRLSGDASIVSDIRSITQAVSQLSKNFQFFQNEILNMKTTIGSVRCKEHNTTISNISINLDDIKQKITDVVRILELRDGKSNLIECVTDLKRIFKLKQGDSDWVVDMDKAIKTLQNNFESISDNKKSITSVFKYIGGQILTIFITLLIAYLMIRFGLK